MTTHSSPFLLGNRSQGLENLDAAFYLGRRQSHRAVFVGRNGAVSHGVRAAGGQTGSHWRLVGCYGGFCCGFMACALAVPERRVCSHLRPAGRKGGTAFVRSNFRICADSRMRGQERVAETHAPGSNEFRLWKLIVFQATKYPQKSPPRKLRW